MTSTVRTAIAAAIHSLASTFLIVTPAFAQQFLPPAPFPVGSNPTHVAVGDFNADGKLDLAVANYGGDVSVLLGNGDGTFGPQVTYTTAGPAEGIAVADFNGDGKLDLAVATDSQEISVLLGNGDGTFRQSVAYLAGSNEIAVCTTDLNGDGKPDLIVGTRTGTLTVLLGLGDGTFKVLPSTSAGSAIYGCASGDFNQDGRPDIVVPDLNSPNLYVLLGNGDGTFLPAVAYDTGSEAATVAVTDLNADGKLDLVKADYSAGVSVLLGKGDGTFQSPQLYKAGSSAYALAIDDFNGDGKPDVVVAQLQSNTVSLVPGNGDGTLGAEVEYTAGANPISIAVGDFNDDGWPDVAVIPEGENNIVTALLNAGQKTGNPVASVTPGVLTFAPQLLNTTSVSQSITIGNVGTGTLELNGIALVGGTSDFSFTNGCGATLVVGTSCTVQISFRPTRNGIRTGSLSIADDTVVSPQTVNFAGTGNSLKLSAPSLNFGRVVVGSSRSQILTLTNLGGQSMIIGPLRVLGMNAADYSQADNCGTEIASHKSCTASVKFTPESVGSSNAHLQFTSNGMGVTAVTAIPLTGIGQ